MSDLVGNPEDRFSRVEAHLLLTALYCRYLDFIGIDLQVFFRKCDIVDLHNHPQFGHLHLSRLMGKPTICIGENKDADQLRGRGNREADQRLLFSLLG